MDWEEGDTSGDIDDRRGIHPGVIGGGVGLGGLVIAAIGYFVFGANPSDTLNAVQAINGGGPSSVQVQGQRGTPADQAGRFVDVIETSTTEVWSKLIPGYQAPAAVVLYDEETPTSCGDGQAAMGPFYCPVDHKVYLDLSFWNELEQRFGAKGEFARAYVIAHEIGHNVQNQTGQLSKSQQLGSQGAASGSVRAELQADCYAGVWAANAKDARGQALLESGDAEEGLRAANAIGDDTLQKSAGHTPVPDSFTHGTSAERVAWLRRGLQSGDPSQCDTFAGSIDR